MRALKGAAIANIAIAPRVVSAPPAIIAATFVEDLIDIAAELVRLLLNLCDFAGLQSKIEEFHHFILAVLAENAVRIRVELRQSEHRKRLVVWFAEPVTAIDSDFIAQPPLFDHKPVSGLPSLLPGY